MPIAALWTFIGSLILLALGLTYKWVENAHGLKLSEKEADRLRTAFNSLEETRKNETLSFKAEIDALKEAHNKEISDIKELHQRETEELRNKLTELTNQAHKESTPDIKYLTVGRQKWEVTTYKDGEFELNEYPICVEHDLKFIFGSNSKYCPLRSCNNQISEHDEFRIHESIKSLIDRNLRNKTWPEV